MMKMYTLLLASHERTTSLASLMMTDFHTFQAPKRSKVRIVIQSTIEHKAEKQFGRTIW
jgi:hypothetical protein